MKTDDLLDAIGKIDARFVKEAEDGSDYEERKTGKGKKTVRFHWKIWLSAAACLCLLVIGVTYGGLRQEKGYESSSSTADNGADSIDSGSSDRNGIADAIMNAGGTTAEESGTDGSAEAGQEAVDVEEEETTGAEEERICINEIKQLNGVEICMIEPASITELTLEEAETYYGLRLMPKILPEGISYDDTTVLSVSYTEDGSVMDDNNSLSFRDAAGKERLRIQARTTESGSITEFADDNLETSVIAGTTLTIGHDRQQEDTDFYIAIYQKGDVTVTVQGDEISEQEMLAVLRSLLME